MRGIKKKNKSKGSRTPKFKQQAKDILKEHQELEMEAKKLGLKKKEIIGYVSGHTIPEFKDKIEKMKKEKRVRESVARRKKVSWIIKAEEKQIYEYLMNKETKKSTLDAIKIRYGTEKEKEEMRAKYKHIGKKK